MFERDASASGPEDQLVELFAQTFGLEKAQLLAHEYPVSPGHTLIIPRRHVASFFDLTRDEVAAVMDLIRSTRQLLDQQHRPNGYNIGVNVGAAAGQTVFHVHVHLIPRYFGDVQKPRGGVRHVVPHRADYQIPSTSG